MREEEEKYARCGHRHEAFIQCNSLRRRILMWFYPTLGFNLKILVFNVSVNDDYDVLLSFVYFMIVDE